MRNVITSAVALTLIAASSANANSVYNQYTNRHETGTSKLRVDAVRTEVGTEYSRDLSAKLEANLGDVNEVNLSFDGTNFTGDAHSSNRRPVDPVVYGTFTEDITNAAFVEQTNTTFTENTNFTEDTYIHTVGNN